MGDVEKEKDDDRLDIPAILTSRISEFRDGLKMWLESENIEEEDGDFEDRDLEALLLKVPHHRQLY